MNQWQHFKKLTHYISIEEMLHELHQSADLNFAKNGIAGEHATEFVLLSQKYKALSQHLQLQQKVYNFFSELKTPMLWQFYLHRWQLESIYILPIIEGLASAADDVEVRIFYIDETVASSMMIDAQTFAPMLLVTDTNERELNEMILLRPKAMEAMLLKLKHENKAADAITEMMHSWYEEDQGQSVQTQLLEAFKQKEAIV
jgi:hypothetical protein